MAARKAVDASEPGVVEQQENSEQAVAETASADIRQAAEKRRAARIGSPEWRLQNDIDGLLVERRGFVQRGDDASVVLVDEALGRLGHKGGAK